MDKQTPEYPEHEKLVLVSDKSQAIGEFLDWINSRKGYVIGKYIENDYLMPVYEGTSQILAEYFDIDLDKIEQEKLAMIESCQKLNG